MRIRAKFVPLLLSLALLILTGASAPLIPLDAIDYARLLPDPPPPASEEGQAELQEMLYLQQTRTPADIARCQDEATLRLALFATVLGPHFNATDLPQTFKLLNQVGHTASTFSSAAKDHWQRPRPPVEFPQIQPCINTPGSYSYPSGHSTASMTWAEVLSNLIPDKRDQLMERGREIGWDRVIAGVHYPSDVADGRVLGHVVAQAILASPQFKAELPAVQAELTQLETAPAH